MQIDGDVDISRVAPQVVPDAIGVAFRVGGAEARIVGVDAGEQAIEIGEEAVLGRRENWGVISRRLEMQVLHIVEILSPTKSGALQLR